MFLEKLARVRERESSNSVVEAAPLNATSVTLAGSPFVPDEEVFHLDYIGVADELQLSKRRHNVAKHPSLLLSFAKRCCIGGLTPFYVALRKDPLVRATFGRDE